MRVAVHAAGHDLQLRILRTLEPVSDVVAASVPAIDARATVVVTDSVLAAIQEPGSQTLRRPIVVVHASSSGESNFPTAHSSFHGVVAAHQIEFELLDTLTAAIIRESLESRIERLARHDLRRSSKLRRGLALALAGGAMASVQRMAREVKRSARSLENDWVACTAGNGGPTLKRLLMAVTFLKALHIRTTEPDTTWQSIAERLGTTTGSISSYARRWAGLPPTQLDIDDIVNAVRRIESEALCALDQLDL